MGDRLRLTLLKQQLDLVQQSLDAIRETLKETSAKLDKELTENRYKDRVYNTKVAVVENVRATSPEQAIRILAGAIADYSFEVLEDESDAFEAEEGTEADLPRQS